MEWSTQWLVQDLTRERGSAVHWRHHLRGSLQNPIHHSLVPTEQHRSFGGGLCDLKASRKLELHSQVCDRRLQGLLEATNDLNVEETLNMMSSLKFISKTPYAAIHFVDKRHTDRNIEKVA